MAKSHTQEDLDWERQLKEVEEAEKWEGSITLIPDDLRPNFQNLLKGFSTNHKIKTMKLLGLSEWKRQICKQMYKILFNTPESARSMMVDLIFSFYTAPHLFHVIMFMSKFRNDYYGDLISLISTEEWHRLTDISKYLQSFDVETLSNLMMELGVRQIFDMLEHCDEPFAKHCRLCRQRRMHNLEMRLLNNQVPEGLIRVPGTLCMYDKAEIWTSADGKSFTFDYDRGRVFWNKELVDLVRICDACLKDVNEAATVEKTFEMHHLDVAEKKHLMAMQKKEDCLQSELLGKLARERGRRRAREFALRALENQRHGRRLEADAIAMQQQEQQLRIEREQEAAVKVQLVTAAMVSENKWKQQVFKTDAKVMAHKHAAVDLTYHLGFGPNNPYPSTREHPHSWRLTPIDANGVPITATAVSKKFASGEDEPEVELMALKLWKKEMVDSHAAYVRGQREIEERRRAARKRECEEAKQYVDDRLRQMAREQKTLERMLEREEDNRVERRQADRGLRRAARIAGNEQQERDTMAIEDDRSYHHRFYLWETTREDSERLTMLEEEMDQCQVDTFWGIDDAARKKQLQLGKQQEQWERRTEELRVKCVKVRLVRPYEEEARNKVFRDRLTNEVLS